jgi:hypothetical protein
MQVDKKDHSPVKKHEITSSSPIYRWRISFHVVIQSKPNLLFIWYFTFPEAQAMVWIAASGKVVPFVWPAKHE